MARGGGAAGGLTRQSVLRWTKLHAQGGMAALQRPQHFGRPRKLEAAQCAELIELLKAGALGDQVRARQGRSDRPDSSIKTIIRPCRAAIFLALATFSVSSDESPPRRARAHDPSAFARSSQAAAAAATPRTGRSAPQSAARSIPRSAAASIAPRGQTPVLQCSFSWKQLARVKT